MEWPLEEIARPGHLLEAPVCFPSVPALQSRRIKLSFG